MDISRTLRIGVGLALLGTLGCAEAPATPGTPGGEVVESTPAGRTDCNVHDLLASAPGPVDDEYEALFPLPDDLKPAYEFWRQAYGNWNNDQAVLHKNRSFDIKVDKDGKPILYDGNTSYVIQYSNRRAAWQARRKKQAQYWRMQRGQQDKLEPAFQFWLAHQEPFDAAMAAEGVHEVGSALGFIESMFQTNAQSATGALGVFQIQPWEGHKLDARVDAAYNELWDPARQARLSARKLKRDSTALRKLADAHGIPPEDSAWPLALLSYNQGVNSMNRAVVDLKTLDVYTVIEKHRGRQYGFAGRNFYAQFRLFADLVRAAKREQCVSPNPVAATQHFTLDAWVTLGDLSACCGVDQATLETLNPGFTDLARTNQARLGPGFPLAVPADQYEAFAAAWAAPETAPPKHAEQVTFAEYRIKRGQNLTNVARRTGTSLFALLAENEMDVPTANRIQHGATVRIPTMRFAQLGSRLAQHDPKPRAFDLHRVRPGETVRTIERRYGLAKNELQKWNDVGSLQAGATVAIPVYR